VHLLGCGGGGTLTQTLGGAVTRRCNGARVLVDVGEDGLEDRKVQNLRAAEAGELEPDDEDGLEREVPGEVVQDGAESNALEEVEETEDDPVCEPLDVILVAGGLEGLERQDGGNGPTDDVGDGPGQGVK